jgi:hypothetical protein
VARDGVLSREDERRNSADRPSQVMITPVMIRRTLDDQNMRLDTPLVKAKKIELLALGYPWPDSLAGKRLSWLDAEIKSMTPKPDLIQFR